jgi:MoaA/NifB/PqqE/SkfB family radical SAM enzyme
MNTLEKNYTSTGFKLLKYLDRLKDFQDGKSVSPVTLHIMPESRCNLKCSFCSVSNRQVHERLDFSTIKTTVTRLTGLGLKGVVISGGGEPCIYPEFEDLLQFLYSQNLKVGLITNGTKLAKVDKGLVKGLSWVRISANTLDYVDDIELPEFGSKTVFGLSYIVSLDTKDNSLQRVVRLADRYNATYVRVSPNCMIRKDQLEKEQERVGKLVVDLNDNRFFHQYKMHSTPKKCFLGYFHPVLYCDGYIYPCDSLVLNSENKEFNESFRLCKAEDIVDTLYKKPAHSTLVECEKLCDSCVWEQHNVFLSAVIEKLNHKEFV